MSEGGPLIIINLEAASDWGGALALKSAEPRFSNDYEKACEIKTYLAETQVKNTFALLLSDAPLDTCFWRDDRGTTYLVRVWYCQPDFDVDQTMKNCPSCLFEDAVEVLTYNVNSSDFIMFDSAEPGDDPDKKFVFAQLRKGAYRILTQTYEPDAETSLVLHRFDWLTP